MIDARRRAVQVRASARSPPPRPKAAIPGRHAASGPSRDLEELAERIVPRYTWDDIVLPPDVLHDLEAAAAQVRYRSLVYGAHGFAGKLPRGPRHLRAAVWAERHGQDHGGGSRRQ